MVFGGFLSQEVKGEKKKSKNQKICIFGFLCVTKHIEGWSNICIIGYFWFIARFG
jgi:hypothetical protein